MNEKDIPNAEPPVPTVPTPTQEPKKVDAIPEIPTPNDEFAEVEKEMSGFEKSTLKWAKTAVILSAVAAVFICLQWYEMHTGGGRYS